MRRWRLRTDHNTELQRLRESPEYRHLVGQLEAEYRRNQRLEESLLNFDNLVSPLEWLDAGYGFPGPGGWRFGRPAHRTQDRTHAPLNYLNEEEWRLHVAMARDLCTRNPLAIGFRDHVSNFIGPITISFVLRGQTPGATASGPTDADSMGEAPVDPLVKACTQAWDDWREIAEWGQGEIDREAECRRRLIVEGETTLRFFEGDSNTDYLPPVRHIEPELIRTPPGFSTMDNHGWGVVRDDMDDECETGIWVCHYVNVSEGKTVPRREYVRCRNNVDRTIVRGLSDFFPVGELLRKLAGLHDNMAHVARLQAAIAWWEQYPNATSTQVANMIQAGADYTRAKLPPNQTGAGVNVSNYEAGTVVSTEERKVEVGPTSRPEGFIQVDSVVLRAVGFRFGTPSYFTGEGADSFAGVLVTGSPFVRIIEDRQERLKAFNIAVAQRVIEFAERTGRLPPGTSRRVRPVATARPVVMADEEKQSRTFLGEFAVGVADPLAYIREKGGDPKVVLANLAQFKKQLAAMGGAPGQQGAPQAPGAPTPQQPGPTEATPPASAGGDGSSPNNDTGPAADELARIFGESAQHNEGDVWQGASGHYFTLSKGRVVPAKAPGAGDETPATHEPSRADHAAGREKRRALSSAAYDHVRTSQVKAGDDLDSAVDKGDVKGIGDSVRATVAEHAQIAAKGRGALERAGATERELAKFDKAVEKAQVKVIRAAGHLPGAVRELTDAKAETKAADDDEDEPVPERPDPDDFEDADEWKAADEKWQDDSSAAEARNEKRQDRRDEAEHAEEEAQSTYDDARDDYESALADSLDGVLEVASAIDDAIGARLDKEDEADDEDEDVEESKRVREDGRKEGEVWQGKSGRYFTLKNGHVVPHAAPGAQDTTAAPHQTLADQMRAEAEEGAARHERRHKDAAAAEHYAQTAQERPRSKASLQADRYKDVARRRRVLAGVKNEGELAQAIGGHNNPDSQPADVTHITDKDGKPVTSADDIKFNLVRREAAVLTLRTGKLHTVTPAGKLVVTDRDADDRAKEFMTAVLAEPAHFFEVKTLLTSAKDAVYMNPKALARKRAWAKRYAISFHVVGVDDRKGKKHSGHRLYVLAGANLTKGHGTVSLDSMQKVNSFADVLSAVKA